MRLVYLSPVPWSSVAQRPHFFVKAALQSGFTSVLWVEPTPSRLPQLKDFRTKLFTTEPNSFTKPEQIEIIKPICIPVEPFGRIYDVLNQRTISDILGRIKKFSQEEETLLVIGKPSRFALKVILNEGFSKVIFDVMDDFPKFFHGISARSMETIHKAVINQADMCLFSSKKLKDKYECIANKSELILNACDEEFHRACLESKKLSMSKKRTFGYVGNIADWFDWEVVINLAKDNPNDKIIIVGPNHSRYIPVLPGNIELQRGVQHSELPKLLASFSYGLIPFKINDLTEAVDPVKYYEYIAAGLPVITTEFGEMKVRIKNGYAVNFSQFKNGMNPRLEGTTYWSTRFSFLLDI